MPVSGALKIISEQLDQKMEDLIPELLEQHIAVFKVAMALSKYHPISPNAVRWWLMRHGYKFDHELNRWVKRSETENENAA